MIEVLTRDRRGRVIARYEPHLGAVGSIQVIRRSRTSHLRRHPAGLKSIGEDIRPAACDCEGQEHVVQFGIGVCLLSLPWAVLPRKILQSCITAPVKAGTQVDEALGSLDQRGQDVRCERVDGEHMRQAVFGRDAPGLPIADGPHCE